MRVELAGGSVTRLVNVFRDTQPLAGEKVPRRLSVDSYSVGLGDPRVVASVPLLDVARWQQFLVNAGSDGDKLLDVLQHGAVKVKPRGGSWVVDVDRIERLKGDLS